MRTPNKSSEECSLNPSKGKNPKSSHLKCMYSDIHSLGNKQEELELCAQPESYDVIGITETWWENSHDWKTTMDGYKLFWKDRKGRRGGGVALYVKEKFESMEVSYGDHKSSTECLWIKIRGIITKGDLMLAVHKSSIRFLEYIEDCFLLQVLDMPTRNGTLLDLLLTNREDLLDNITTNGSLGCRDHNIVEFKILLHMLKTLDFRRANFKMLRAQLRGIPWEASMEGKGACKCWELFKNSLLEAQEHLHPLQRERKKANKRPPWLNKDLLGVLKSKKEAYRLWKGIQIAIEDYKNLARACRDAVRKAKAQLELKLAKDVKYNKKGFFRYVSSKQKHREDRGLLLNRAGKLVTTNADKAEVLNTFFASVFIGIAGPQITGSSSYSNACVVPPVAEEGLVCGLLQRLDPHKSMGQDGIHPRVLREVADIVAQGHSL
ncbi:hypothetical protein QYF61_012593 [Mycteria americana]|uniref:Uncharacterized protein n=1 Tax=Mycteria americana TaxID=33587 RepID=A0AAN7MZS4_MYCAM|nr:hypothetical protein QYF61_012593 [Mycteria americana]